MINVNFHKLALAPTSYIESQCKKIPEKPRFFIYGAGNIGKKIYRGLVDNGHLVGGFLDNNPLLHGRRYGDAICIPFVDLKPSVCDVCVICIWHYQHDPARSLEHASQLGFLHVLHFSAVTVWLNLCGIFPNYAVDHPAKFFQSGTPRRIDELLNTLSDSASRNTALKILHFHATADMKELPQITSRALPFDPSKILTYIDGGAFDGDDFKKHLDDFTSLEYARLLEPDPHSFQLLKRLNYPLIPDLIAVNAALSDAPGSIGFRANGDWGSMVVNGPSNDGDIYVDCITLDILCEAVPSPIYIKMDLEGHELNALQGAHKLLQSDDAIFSITLEHKALDIFDIPELISKYKHRKSFLFAHDSEFCMDLVLYSVPEKLLSKL